MKEKNQKENSELHPNERDLIYLIRNKYRFGEISIKTHDGLPMYVEKTIEREKLGEIDT